MHITSAAIFAAAARMTPPVPPAPPAPVAKARRGRGPSHGSRVPTWTPGDVPARSKVPTWTWDDVPGLPADTRRIAERTARKTVGLPDLD